jgi:predicted mannosyl-3-phosphoglycerate phosphatase (HAD superfamily)
MNKIDNQLHKMNYLIGFKQDDNDDARLNEYVRQRGNKWVVLSRKGKVLGTHDTKSDAVNQLKAIEANKHA